MERPGVGIGVFIFKDKKFLMILRHGAHGKGSWSVPGGWMEFGESFEDTAKREVCEEVG
jgi:8-oxo-dGTP diphosphatase